MKKTLFFNVLIGLMLIMPDLSHAKSIDAIVAQKVAEQFYRQQIQPITNVSVISISSHLAFTKNSGAGTLFYIFNIDRNKGFVAVSADDRVYPILGYSFTGNISMDTEEDLSPGFMDWMEDRALQVQLVLERHYTQDSSVSRCWQQLYDTAYHSSMNINSLLLPMNTLWNQNKYYNASCPSTGGIHPAGLSGYDNRVPTGCVATAMAQLMKFWNYPNQGSGSKTYTDLSNSLGNPCSSADPSYGSLTANFGSTTYNWTNMPNSLSGYNNSIATLMSHAGISVSMDYAYCGSGASLDNTRNALVNNFVYASMAQIISKSSYTQTGWESALVNEIDAHRPVFYTGFNASNSGHAFVCHGYQSTSQGYMFYFNWGWGGSQNGYFYVSSLSPQILFPNTNQAIIKVFPPNRLPDYVIQNLTVSPATVNAGSSVNISYQQKNQGVYYAGPSRTRYYYSLDNTYSSDDYELGYQDEGEVSAGGYVTRTKTLTIPSFATPGTRYIIVYADKDNSVLETNESNNTQVYAITVQSSCVNCPSYDYNITTSTSWQTHSASHPTNGCKMYRISVTSGNEYTFKTGCGDGAIANYDTYLELFNSGCSSIISNDDGCENNRSKITLLATTSGYVYLKVRGFNGSGGSYTLAYRYVNQSAPCLNCPTYDYYITPSTSWQTHSSSHGINGCKVYRVSVIANRTYTFKTGCGNNATANYDTYLELFNSGCSIIASNDDGCESSRSILTWTSTYSGYTYLKVRGYNGAGGNYTLAYNYVSLKDLTQEKIIPNDSCLIYPNPANISVMVEISGSNFLTSLEIYNSLGVQLKKVMISGKESRFQMMCLDLPSGAYIARVYCEKGMYTRKLIIQK